MQVGWETLQGFSEVYVAFEDTNCLWWLKFLKPGFRHCYVILVAFEKHAVVLLNPRSNRIDVELYTSCNTKKFMTEFARKEGVSLCRVHMEETVFKPAPFMVFTCVEFVKRVLGIHNISIITPYQLYKKIKNSRKNILTF